MKAPSFRLKIALLSAGISGMVLLAFGLAAWLLVSRQKLESLDTSIRSFGSSHPGWISNRRDFKRLDENLEFIVGEGFGNQVILQARDASDGSVLYTSPGWPGDLDANALDWQLETAPDAQPESSNGGGGFRGGRGWGGQGRGMGPGANQVAFTRIPEFQSLETRSGPWRIGLLGTADTLLAVGLNEAAARAELDHLRNAFLLALPAALFLVGLGGWLVAGRALRPMRMIATTAAQVTARGLDQRIPISHEDPEITRVIEVLNRMMDRLEASFHQATRFSADASHELKTPLAIMQGELENALHEARPGSVEQQTFNNLLEETQRLKTITRSLLMLARADAGQLVPALEPVDLTAILEDIADDTRVLGEEKRLRIDVSLAPGVTLRADPSLLHTALLNLFVNAVKYNEPDGVIRIRLTIQNGMAEMSIGNSGPGIPEADRERIFTRFHRVDAARQRRVDGIGLGLSLACEIVRAHGGELELAESRPGWTGFVLRMPLDHAASHR
ncbi:MAG: sensor histidine kinase [Verrucomicrobiota bacterium JB025]|nr:ATP-binding protein [Verrucomicrobiota bacterium JB025]